MAAAKEQRTLSTSHDSRLVADALERRLPSAASSDVTVSQQVLPRPATVGQVDARLYENLDPALWPVKQSVVGLQGTDSEGSDASEEEGDDADTSDGDEDGADGQIGWGESGGRHNAHPGT